MGASPKAADEPVRLGQRPSMRFAPAELAALEPPRWRAPAAPAGLFPGPAGTQRPPAPAPDRVRAGAAAQRLGPHLRALPGPLQSPDARPPLPGLGPGPADGQLRPPGRRTDSAPMSRPSAGLACPPSRTATPCPTSPSAISPATSPARPATRRGSRRILGDLLGLPVRIEEFVGHWLVLPPDCRLRLGETRETGALGQTHDPRRAGLGPSVQVPRPHRPASARRLPAPAARRRGPGTGQGRGPQLRRGPARLGPESGAGAGRGAKACSSGRAAGWAGRPGSPAARSGAMATTSSWTPAADRTCRRLLIRP